MKKHLISMFLGFVLLAALTSTALAQMCGCMGEKGGGMQQGCMMGGMGQQGMGMMHDNDGMQHSEMMMNDDHPLWKKLMGLGLDDKQKEALKALRSRTMKEMARKKADKQIAGIELKDLLEKEPVDLKAVEAAAKKEESLKTEMFLTRIRAHEEMKALLTPEQRKQLKEMMEGRDKGCDMMHDGKEQRPMREHEHMH